MKLNGQAISVARIALSYMMTGLLRIRAANLWAIFMKNADEGTLVAYATLRFVGDALDPEEISGILTQQPTRAYRQGQRYHPDARSPETTGKTGVWYFSTKRSTTSKILGDHLAALEGLISPFADDGRRIRTLREIMEQRSLKAHVTCFWRGVFGAVKPSISAAVIRTFGRLPADIETDFDNEDP
jgi:Domain of unknown function (DUF4279)